MPGAEGLEGARALVRRSSRLVAFTGAGVSTASGVPDFRSPGGIWSRYQPVTIQEFRRDADARRRYWAYRRETFADFQGARPNAAHAALADAERSGLLAGVITQNIDGLHQDAGNRVVLELHGTNRRVGCLDCGAEEPAEKTQERLNAGCEVPACDSCGGPMKAATVSFGQSLDSRVLDEAFRLALASDLLLVLGSSLVVYPAAAIPRAAAEAGVEIVLINREPTPLDGEASIVLRGEVEELLPALMAP